MFRAQTFQQCVSPVPYSIILLGSGQMLFIFAYLKSDNVVLKLYPKMRFNFILLINMPRLDISHFEKIA